MPFEFERLDIPDVILVRAKLFSDDRGFFVETYKRDDFAANGIKETFVQDNHSRSTRGVLRGLHYQKAPRAQGKLIQVDTSYLLPLTLSSFYFTLHHAL